MAAPEKPTLRLYVRSLPLPDAVVASGPPPAASVIGNPGVSAGGPGAMGGRRTDVPEPNPRLMTDETGTAPELRGNRTMPQEDLHCIEVAREAAERHGYHLHVVDVGEESIIHEKIEETVHHLKQFPALLHPSGRRLEGLDEFTVDRLDAFLTQ
ncbi:MAG: hypothetical protein WCA77_00740 [Thermoplasmata archaeon]